jgi:hypothetical protein
MEGKRANETSHMPSLRGCNRTDSGAQMLLVAVGKAAETYPLISPCS